MDASKTINDAVRAFRAGRSDEGQQLLEKVLKYQPTNQQAVQLLAQIQQQSSRALVSVETDVEMGWSRLVTCTIDDLVVGDDPEPLVHRRGRYATPGG